MLVQKLKDYLKNRKEKSIFTMYEKNKENWKTLFSWGHDRKNGFGVKYRFFYYLQLNEKTLRYRIISPVPNLEDIYSPSLIVIGDKSHVLNHLKMHFDYVLLNQQCSNEIVKSLDIKPEDIKLIPIFFK